MRACVRDCLRVHGTANRFYTFVAGWSSAPVEEVNEEYASGADALGPEPVRAVRAAHSVFTPAELTARLAAYAERAAQRLPLFTDGAAEPEPVTLTTGRRAGQPVARFAECYVCSRRVPAQASRGLGWHVRALAGGQGETETYCPECFGVFGWGGGDDE